MFEKNNAAALFPSDPSPTRLTRNKPNPLSKLATIVHFNKGGVKIDGEELVTPVKKKKKRQISLIYKTGTTEKPIKLPELSKQRSNVKPKESVGHVSNKQSTDSYFGAPSIKITGVDNITTEIIRQGSNVSTDKKAKKFTFAPTKIMDSSPPSSE